MDFSWDKYPEIKRHFGEKWLRIESNTIHPIFTILHEIKYLRELNRYLQDVQAKKQQLSILKPQICFGTFIMNWR